MMQANEAYGRAIDELRDRLLAELTSPQVKLVKPENRKIDVGLNIPTEKLVCPKCKK